MNSLTSGKGKPRFSDGQNCSGACEAEAVWPWGELTPSTLGDTRMCLSPTAIPVRGRAPRRRPPHARRDSGRTPGSPHERAHTLDTRTPHTHSTQPTHTTLHTTRTHTARTLLRTRGCQHWELFAGAPAGSLDGGGTTSGWEVQPVPAAPGGARLQGSVGSTPLPLHPAEHHRASFGVPVGVN